MPRYPLLILLLGLLAACDDKPTPAPDPVPAPPGAPEVQAPQPASPPSAEAQSKATAPLKAPPSTAAKALEPAPRPAAKVLPAPGSQALKGPGLAKSTVKPAAKAVASKALPPAKLDLRLPAGMLEQLQPEEATALDFSRPALLPEMFVEKPAAPGPFELNGRLITNDHSSEDYWDSVEGAELQFKFRN